MTIERPMFPPVDPTRRGFLAQAAAAAAGGAALGVALPLPGSVGASERVPDPILDVIERHRTARADWLAAVDTEGRLEEELSRDRRQSLVTVWEQHIVLTDDPRWIAAEENTLQTSDVMDDRACDLVNIKPMTIPGLAALLIYVATVEKEGDGDLAWPPGLVDEEEDVGQRGKSWSCFLHSHLADSLQAMATGVQS